MYELEHGALAPAPDVPARVFAIADALPLASWASFHDPVEHGIGPILALHDPGLVEFLKTAWGAWTDAGYYLSDLGRSAGGSLEGVQDVIDLRRSGSERQELAFEG